MNITLIIFVLLVDMVYTTKREFTCGKAVSGILLIPINIVLVPNSKL